MGLRHDYNAYLLQAISGLDPMDSTSAHVDVPNFTEKLEQGVKGLKVAVPREYLGDGVDPEVADSVREALKILERDIDVV